MSDWPEFRIEVSIQRNDGSDEYREIGFCAGDSDHFDDAVYEATTALNRREWETNPGMPEPEEVDEVKPWSAPAAAVNPDGSETT